MNNYKDIKETSDATNSIQMVKYFDKTVNHWKEGMLWQEISIKNNIWEVYFPATSTCDGCFLAVRIKNGLPQKDYYGYKIIKSTFKI